MDGRGDFCLMTLTNAAGQLVTDKDGNPWITALCIACGHAIGLKTMGEIEASGQASIERIP